MAKPLPQPSTLRVVGHKIYKIFVVTIWVVYIVCIVALKFINRGKFDLSCFERFGDRFGGAEGTVSSLNL